MSTISQHPDADQLSAFVEDALPPHEREETLAHLAACSHCRSIVALSLPPVAETLPQPKPVRKPWLSGWRLAIPGAVAAPLFAFLLILALHNRKAPESIAVAHPQPIPQAAPEKASKSVVPPQPSTPNKPQAVMKAQPPTLAQQTGQQIVVGGDLPVQNRNVAPLPPPPAGNIMGAISPAPQQTESIATEDANASGVVIQTKKQALAMSLRQTARDLPFAALPSNFPIASTAANGSRVLALDTQNVLFRSEDAGQHWIAVAAAWTGRAVRVDLGMDARRRAVAASAAAPAPRALAFAPGNPVAPASLSGTVTDATGAAIPKATVTVASRTSQTDGSGHYAFSGLAAGSYTLEATASGFRKLIQPVTVTPSTPTISDLRLSIGSTAQTVEVTASGAIDLISTPSLDPNVAPALPILFELTTESGEHWTSPDGQTWKRR